MSSTGEFQDPVKIINAYIKGCPGLQVNTDNQGMMSIIQHIDGKSIQFATTTVEEVLERSDVEGNPFLQVNFIDGRKILITEKLIGFKPAHTTGLDLKKLPKVVTTPDLLSVVEAIEESLNCQKPRFEEVEVLRRVFDSVLAGAQSVGFVLEEEKAWLSCISTIRQKTTA
jgi:hypothetical protein